ncbi:hypothetical protein H0H92_007344 [Tricholoma furcatifolium]|nr:hypothetical protein H0H92_007344 [Tricholoma furcatifolium]
MSQLKEVLAAVVTSSLKDPSSTHPTILRRQNALTQGFESAQWIWTPEYGVTPPIAPPGSRAFRTTYTPPSGLSATSADILMTVDNYYTLYVCGTQVGSTQAGDGEGWRTSQLYHVSISGSGPIVLAIEGVNLADLVTGADTYAGVMTAMQVTHSDGSTAMVTSDSSWRASNTIPDNFYLATFDDSSWENPNSLGAYGVSPWLKNVTIATSNSGTSSVTASAVSLPTSTSPTSSTSSTSGNAHVSSSSSSLSLSPSSTSIPGASNTESGLTVVAGYTTAYTISSGSTLFSTMSFTDSPATSSGTPATQDTTTASRSTSLAPIVGGAIGGVVILAVLVFLAFCLRRRQKRKSSYVRASLDVVQPSSEDLLIQPFTLANPVSLARDIKGGIIPMTVGFSTSDTLSQAHDSEPSSSATGGQPQIPRILMAELDRETIENGESTSYGLELRGRIAALSKELEGGADVRYDLSVPPPYQQSSGPVGTP